jgi:hypothetical protein
MFSAGLEIPTCQFFLPHCRSRLFIIGLAWF